MRARRPLLAVGAEQPVEPTLALQREGRRALDAGLVDRVEDRAERDPLLGLVARDGVGEPGHLRLQDVSRGEQSAALVVEGGGHIDRRGAEGAAVGVAGLDREPRLRRAKREVLALPRHAGGEEGVLERVLALGELAIDDPFLARDAKARDLLPTVVRRVGLGSGERLELLTGEEVGVARNDRGLLRRLLLPHADGARLLRALLEIRVEATLERLRVEAHAATSAPRRRRASDVSRPSSSSDS